MTVGVIHRPLAASVDHLIGVDRFVKHTWSVVRAGSAQFSVVAFAIMEDHRY